MVGGLRAEQHQRGEGLHRRPARLERRLSVHHELPDDGGQRTPSAVPGAPPARHRGAQERGAQITERVKAAGSHEIKAGIDAEDNTTNKARLLSGGAAIEFNDIGANVIDTIRYAQLAGQEINGVQGSSPTNTDPGFFNQQCNTANPNPTNAKDKTQHFDCAYLGGTPGSRATQIQGETFNWAAYLRDSWQIQPNLTLNAGLRYEEQRLRYASFLQGTVDPLTGNLLGKDAMTLTGNYAPRIGLLYDWTKEGRSKIYANWGRFYESIPLDINDRSFGGEVEYEQLYTASTCTNMGMAPAVDPKIGGVNGNSCITPTTQTGAPVGGGLKQRWSARAVISSPRASRRSTWTRSSPASSTRSSTTSSSACRTRTARSVA